MIICPKCKDILDLNDKNSEAIIKDGQTIGWQHRICPKIEKNLKEN